MPTPPFQGTLFLDFTQGEAKRDSHNRHFSLCNVAIVFFLLYSDGDHSPDTTSEDLGGTADESARLQGQKRKDWETDVLWERNVRSLRL